MPYPQYAHGFSYSTQSWGIQGTNPTFKHAGKSQPPKFYKDGDEWIPAGRDSDQIIDMQRKLVMGGYLDPMEGFDLGKWDEKTRLAYKALLEDANGQGLDADSAIRRAIQNGERVGKGGRMTIDPETGELVEIPYQGEPLQLQLPNKDDLRRVFTAAATDKLGQALPPEAIEDMVDAYTWKQIQFQKQGYDFQEAQGRAEWEGSPMPQGALVREEPPTPEGFAEAEAKRRDPGGFQATQAYDYAQEFFNALGGYS
jgi:hypothetical protein